MRVVLVVWTALTVGALLAPVGARIGWQWHGGLPSEVQSQAIIGTVEFTRHEPLSGPEYPEDEDARTYWFTGTDEYSAGYLEGDLDVTDLAAVAGRLRAEGWRTGDPDGDDLTAALGDWRLTVWRADPRYGSPGQIRIERAEPVASAVLSVVFWLGGLALGWVVARRSTRARLGLGIAALGLLTLHTLVVTPTLVSNVALQFGTGTPVQLWEPLMSFFIRPLTLLGAAAGITWLVSGSRMRA
ncbi:hypothetical protein GCM10010435_77520 [Winogradskya consettensis]